MNALNTLFSHFQPTLPLKAHIRQVLAAARFLLANYSPQVRERRPETSEVLEALVRCHDLGKGSPAFQQYIRNPDHYRDDPRKKEHSALSAALAILWARAQGWAPPKVLALAQGIARHHAGFTTLDHLWNARLRLDDDDVLEPQWRALDLASLSEATDLDLKSIEGEFEEGGRWLFRRQKIQNQLESLPLHEGIRFRLWTQFMFSILLEADKAFLALHREKLRLYLCADRQKLPLSLVDTWLSNVRTTPLNPLRQQIRMQILDNLDHTTLCSTLTLPTGVGKTLLAASWALTLREHMENSTGIAPRIIIVLPYLSIIDQTEQEYRRLLGLSKDNATQSDKLMASHSLAQREYELEGRILGNQYTQFFIDTWRSEVVLTTFDQLLLALFSGKTRHLIRFHRLMDALIILDEVQTLPCILWNLADHALHALTEEGNSRVLMMSATQPALLSNAQELAGGEEKVTEIFSRFRRYRIHFHQQQTRLLEDFISELYPRLDKWVAAGKRVLITLNTRASARKVWQAVSEHLGCVASVYLISADITPRDRLIKISAIKESKPCIVVSTQTVEAGVDIDMDVTLRDFAPLDALIQVAGRCNRNNRLGNHGGEVEIVSLMSEKSRNYAHMVYDSVLLDASYTVLEGLKSIGEEGILDLSQRYFTLLKERVDTGKSITEAFAYWREMPDIHSLLRGKEREQVLFLVLDDEKGVELHKAIERALAITDRWERREELQRLAGAIQKRTVSIYAGRNLHPEDYADLLGPLWVLNEGWYSTDSGLDLQLEEDDPACII